MERLNWADIISIGQRAEALLRIAAWHVDDARGEAHARTLGHEPTIPPHERVYERDADGRFLICHTMTPLTGGCSWTSAEGREETARAILDDHKLSTFLGGQILKYRCDRAAMDKSFAALAIASLPDGPWTMTSRDVERFLELILEEPRLGQDGEPVRDVTAAEYVEHCERHEPPPLGCEHHHEPGDRCGPWYAGGFALVLADVEPVPFIPWRGSLGFFDVPDEVIVEAVRRRDEPGTCPCEGKLGPHEAGCRNADPLLRAWTMAREREREDAAESRYLAECAKRKEAP